MINASRCARYTDPVATARGTDLLALLLPLSFLLCLPICFGRLKAEPAGDHTRDGVLNVTPIVSGGSQFYDREAALTRALRMIDEGADIIDIGGERRDRA